MMKIISYNVNGIRAAFKKDFIGWLKAAQPDVLCLQETKAQKEQVDTEAIEKLGYHHYWFSAEKKGYSGVSIICKEKPNHIEYGTGIEQMDFEGRVIRADFDNCSVVSMYLPSGTNTDRLEYKFKFMDEIHDYFAILQKKTPHLVVCGDFNICHKAIDIHDPVRNKNISGFLSEERAWMDRFVNQGFVDSFRKFNSEPHQYSWWSYRANSRANNKGWRLDYAMVSEPLSPKISRAYILSEAYHSDHCPVAVELDFKKN